MTGQVRYRRIYEDPSPEDGKRVLVDRLWPRGVSKEEAGLDEWLKDVAPSTDLRRWYHHDPERFAEFRERYVDELHDPEHQEAVQHLRGIAAHDDVTLLTATKDADHSEAAVLAQWLNDTPE
ncbi:DUF488 domain-containing protein [Streptomyces sp. 15-116A]|uniref:DUF488 domain-containing protein n=1 Tax=Streptomyces sp. 15-116A TaxID=2259035 RepID=UPI0021B4AA32|nr:DUF488 domain-containing protein [Streptomyces sp. 15-116A]MCT7354723.1 DUF488 domain-containing protein [Streptomyces sp. 15-116A]